MPAIRHPAQFEREHGCTEAEWLAWLPGATRGQAFTRPDPGQAVVPVAAGRLNLHWTVLSERRIALVRLPRLQVRYQFEEVAPAQRDAFMQYFDLYMQRGGG